MRVFSTLRVSFAVPTALLSALLAVFAAGLLAPVAQAQQAGSERVVDGIAAVVENDVILRSEIEGQVRARMRQQQQQQGQTPPRDELWADALQRRINEQVLVAHAERDTTVNVPETQIQQVLERRIEGLAQRAGGRDQLEEIYGRTINELKVDFEDQVRQQLLAQRFREDRLSNVRITPTEVRDWFEQVPQDSLPTIPATVQLSHIVRYPEPTPSAERQAREVIAAIRDSALAGVPIEDLARRYSDDPGTGSQGGRYEGSLDGLVPSFAAVVSRAPIGEVSRVFETPFGYHVARVNERSGSSVDFNHVLIEVDKSTSSGDEAKEYLAAVRDSIVEQGAPFGPMARRHSQEERSAGRGGRVADPRSGESTLRYDPLGSDWKRTIDGLEPGDISPPSEARLLGPQRERAFQLVRLEERTPRHRMSLEQDYDRIKEFALQEKQMRVYQRWVQKLREDVYVDVRPQPGQRSTRSR